VSSPRPVIIGVVRSGGGPVPLARVFLESAPGPIPDVALLTDAEGRFTIGTVGPGSYRLTVHSDDHHPATVTVEIGTQDATVEILLKPTG
jgi:carboxypeptidase family protein